MKDEANMRAPLSLLPLRLDDVEFAAGARHIIRGLSATIDAGPRTVILGPNGAGKSVLLRLCHGLLEPTAGTISWNAPELPGGPRRQAMVFQRPVLLRRTVLGNVMYVLKLSEVPRWEREGRAREALRKVGLDAQSDQAARVLSGGEQQRLALARVWALRPEILFLDEPTASLDPGAAHEIENVILALARGRHEDRAGDAQPGAGASARRRGSVPASGPAGGACAGRPISTTPGLARGRQVS